MNRPTLDQLLEHSARQYPNRIAAVEPGLRSIRYDDLNQLANSISRMLQEKGVKPGDRLGVHLPKSIPALASIFGILRADAAYVPVDSAAPQRRNQYIFSNCAVKYVISLSTDCTGVESADAAPYPLDDIDPLLNGLFLVAGSPNAESKNTSIPADLAYILYTSGSTGLPKGVMLTHGNAFAFIDWCSSTFHPDERDRFSSHAPFYFDLSILDIYLPIKHGSNLVLIPEEVGRQPKELAALISRERISVWYSTPTILKLLLRVPGIKEYDHSALRAVLFAGEVFPIKQLRELQKLWPAARYFNLYGPTETNVCTFYELPERLPDALSQPVPIGKVCSGDSAMIVGEDGGPLHRGMDGELYVTGPSVTSGYWNLPERNATAFFRDADGVSWYKTGDIVREDEHGDYVYVGRRDRMIKRRGYRVELGEIEAALYRHDSITEAAVIALPDQADGVRIVAFINWHGDGRPSVIALKRFCIDNLPAYMIPDIFSVQSSLPKTSTDKIDYQGLKELA
ncbi:MAG: amino acid adenylation domain-containing protein [Woeseiaceae bacterium]